MRIAVVLGLLAALGQEPPPLHVVLISGSKEYRSEPSLISLQEQLEKTGRVKCSRAFGEDKGTSLPGLEALATADVLVVFARRISVPPQDLERLKAFCAAEKGIVGLRTASHAFQTWLEFDKEILGGDYKGHFGDLQVAVANVQDHPVLAGIAPFTSPDHKLYKNPSPAADVVVLQRGTAPGADEPVTWVREHKGRRVFYTSLGTPDDFKNESFRRLLANAVFWAARREPPPR